MNNIDICCRAKDVAYKKWRGAIDDYLMNHPIEPKYLIKVEEHFANNSFFYPVSLDDSEVDHLNALSQEWDDLYELEDDPVVARLMYEAEDAGNETLVNIGEWTLGGWDLNPKYPCVFTVLELDAKTYAVTSKHKVSVCLPDEDLRTLLAWRRGYFEARQPVPFQHLRSVFPDIYNLVADVVESYWTWPLREPCPPYLIEMTDVDTIAESAVPHS